MFPTNRHFDYPYLTSILVNIKNMQFSMLQFPHEIEIEVFLTRFINSKLFYQGNICPFIDTNMIQRLTVHLI